MGLITFFNTDDCEWSDVRVDIAGSRLRKLRGVKYGEAVDKEYEYAEGNDPRAIKHGNSTPRGEVKVLLGALNDMNKAAIAQGAKNILKISFPMVITYRAKGSRQLQVDTLTGVEFVEFDIEILQGDKSVEVTLPIMYLTATTAPLV